MTPSEEICKDFFDFDLQSYNSFQLIYETAIRFKPANLNQNASEIDCWECFSTIFSTSIQIANEIIDIEQLYINRNRKKFIDSSFSYSQKNERKNGKSKNLYNKKKF